MNLPPWLRCLQQSWWFHIAQAAAMAGLMAYLTCSPTAHPEGCFSVALTTFVGSLWLSLQHSPGSASFHPNGTVNEMVQASKTQ